MYSMAPNWDEAPTNDTYEVVWIKNHIGSE